MRIEGNEIHLWHIDQKDFSMPELEQYCLAWLDNSELSRFRRYHLQRSRKQLLLGRFLLRSVLSQYDQVTAPSQWQFSQNQYGKPHIHCSQQTLGLYFNLSHSSDRLVLAVTQQPLIGIDIEFSDKNRRVSKIANRYFSTRETEQLLSLGKESQLERFYTLWTLKEAYIKACGLGLAIPLGDFSYSFPGSDSISIEFDSQRNDEPEKWQFWQLRVDGLGADEKYRLALACKSDEGIGGLQSWKISSLQLGEYAAGQLSKEIGKQFAEQIETRVYRSSKPFTPGSALPQ